MENNLPITVALVEDNHSFRSQMENTLQQMKVEVISASENYDQGLAELTTSPPDVILMDIQLTGDKTGIDLVRVLRDRGIVSKIIMLTSFDRETEVFQSLKNGADGYLIKGETKEVILEGIQDVMENKAPISPGIASKLVNHFKDSGQETKELTKLSKRENEILKVLSGGFLYKEVADQLGISPETVKKHASSIYRKLHVSNKTEAINIFNKR